jgi:quercetin dioxygenase-like cupin family protein
MSMDRYNWQSVPVEQMNPQVTRQVIHTPHMTIARLRLAKGAIVPEHQHPNEQVCMVSSGALVFHMGGQNFELRGGSVLRVPPDLPHSVSVLEDAEATDLFTPAREDWIRGDDAYLRGGGPSR